MPDSWVPSGIKYNPPLPVVLERSAWATATKSIGGLVTIQTMEMFGFFSFFKWAFVEKKENYNFPEAGKEPFPRTGSKQAFSSIQRTDNIRLLFCHASYRASVPLWEAQDWPVACDNLGESGSGAELLGDMMQGHKEGHPGPDLVQHPALNGHEQQTLPLLYLPSFQPSAAQRTPDLEPAGGCLIAAD